MISRDFTVRPSVWVTSIVVLLLGLIYAWLTSYAEIRYSTKDLGAAKEARKNPFLAAEMFLAQQNIDVSLERNFQLLDSEISSDHVLLITNSRKPLSETRIQNIWQYVEQGGHLILTANEFFDDAKGESGAPFLDKLNARLYPDEGATRSMTEEELDDLSEEDYDDYIDELNETRITFAGYEKETVAYFPRNRYLLDASGESTFRGGTNESIHIMQYDHGEGVITVLSSNRIWNNDFIDRGDHAMLLYQLVEGSNKVWLIYNPQFDSLFSLLWQHGYYVLISALILLLSIIWFHQIKTGPVFPKFSNNSRQLLQHISAASEFKWLQGDKETLLKAARDDVIRRLKRVNPTIARDTPENQVQFLHKITEIEAQQLTAAFYNDADTPIEFTNQMKTLQKVRHLLHGNTL